MAKLGKELFSKMQAIQGHSFLSDAIEELSDDRVLELAPIILEWQEEGVKVLREFLEAHLTKPAPDAWESAPLKPLSTPDVDSDLGKVPTPAPRR